MSQDPERGVDRVIRECDGRTRAMTRPESPNVGGILTLGKRYGARFIVHRGVVPGGASIILLQLGGYISF